MPLNKELKRVMVIGSGPIVIGQAAEFDYAGTQACRALKEAGLEVILVNSNPATIMTDNIMADKIYIEPLNLDTIKRIIEKERPDSLLSSLGGQTGLTLSMQLAKEGFLDKMGVKLLGAKPETIDKAEDRQSFKDTMEAIDQPIIPSKVVTDLHSALSFANEIGYPVIVRPAFTLGGTGGGIADNVEELTEIAGNGLRLSPINQILVEKCISGWKEIEFEVMRDSKGNAITICSMENFDPVGIHTGDSIVAAPCLTLSDKEYQMLRTAALRIVNELKVEGGCNCQFALNPNSFEYAVIEVNPRVSRSSALASKATGYPIAKVATKVAIGYTLDEITNAVTGKTSACFEPSIDYVVVKFPKWPFDKFVYAKRKLGTQMKATGEVMSIGQSFEEALMKAVRGAEIKHISLNQESLGELSEEQLIATMRECTDERLFIIYELLKRGKSIDFINEETKIDKFFLYKLANILDMENTLQSCDKLTDELYIKAKKMGFPDKHIEALSGKKVQKPLRAGFKMVDTCAAEFSAETPYFYSSFDEENEAEQFLNEKKNRKKTIIVFGSGPIRIGQGIEFDYASVHCVRSLKKLGYDVVIVNNNPETVSTDFDTADRLYFEPLTDEDVLNILETEKPYGVVVAFGGQTAIKLTSFLDKLGVRILGTSAQSIDAAEDRKLFDALLESLDVKRPVGYTVFTEQEALAVANRVGYPVLMRPSYVLGGQNMIIAQNDADIKEYMEIILTHTDKNPILIDKYLMGLEIEVDAICDGRDILIPGIMEHVEKTGVHSGDSIAVYPAQRISDEMRKEILETTRKLAVALNTRGLVNIQYLIHEGGLYVIEVNPRSSRTIPYISKVTGIPMVDIATRTMIGKEECPEKTEYLSDMGYGVGIYPDSPYVAVKVPVFSFEKLGGVDSMLGPEMKSTGEVLGIASSLREAICKGLIAAGYNMKHKGGVLVTVRDSDKEAAVEVSEKFHNLGFKIYASDGTGKVLQNAEVPCEIINGTENRLEIIDSGKINYVISTSDHGRTPTRNSVILRRKAIERSVPCLTSLDTAGAVADSLFTRFTSLSTELVDINNMRNKKTSLKFTKMQGTGNDYIYFNCFEQKINNPEGLAVSLSDRHFGIGGDGVVLICRSDVADAKMRIFNLDGSEGKMSGNAIRCVGKYLYDNKIVDKTDITIETLVGIKSVKLFINGGKVESACVDMGKAELKPANIPVNLPGDSIIAHPITLGYKQYRITCLSMGNPHCVVFYGNGESVDDLDLATIGPMFETNELFPERINTEFVKVINDHTLKMRVWERGNGETWACGTGACAAAIAACLCGYCKKNTDITVKLKGGNLVIRYTDDAVYLTGNADISFTGEITI